MLDRLTDSIPGFRDKYGHLFKEKSIGAKTTLLLEGEMARYMYFIREGCLRLWFNKDGKDITFQFFFENQAVSSIESFIDGKPSLFSLESIEPSRIIAVSKKDFSQMLQDLPELNENFQKIVIQRLGHYARLFLSRIKDSPMERYIDLVNNHPHVADRVPQHYIASYLGITAVSLSRLKKRL